MSLKEELVLSRNSISWSLSPAQLPNFQAGVFGDGFVAIASYSYHRVYYYDLNGKALNIGFGVYGNASASDGYVYCPRAMAVDRNGNILIGDDYASGRIQVIDKTGVLRKKIPSASNFGNVYSIAIDYNTGNIFVGDYSSKKIVVLDADGTFVRKFGTSGSGEKEFSVLNGLAISQNGDIIVADGSTLKVWTQEGVFKARIGAGGKATGEFDSCNAVAVDGAGNVIVADFGNKRLQMFDSSYKFLQQIPTTNSPTSVSIDGEGRVLLIEQSTSNFYILG